jgi:cytochrome c-type biogenesis protein CcmH/NrfG
MISGLLCAVAFAGELDKAREHINAMEYIQAITIIEKHLATNSNDLDARYLLARTYAWDNQYDKAEQVYTDLLKRDHNNTQYMFGKAQALVWQNKNAEAVVLLDKVIKLVPEEIEPWRVLILTLQQSNKPADKERVELLSNQARARFPTAHWELIDK